MLSDLVLIASLCVPLTQQAEFGVPSPQPERAALQAPDGRTGDQFGSDVAISGDVLVIGAEFDNTTSGPKSGSVYTFRRNGFSWVFEDKLRPADSGTNKRFGNSVALDGDTLVVGSVDRFDTMPRAGSVYVFRFDGTDWIEEAKLRANDPMSYTFFGSSVDIDGDTLIVGTDQDGPGSAYIFRHDGTSWAQEAKLIPSDSTPRDSFGLAVAIEGDTAVIGAPTEDHAQPGWDDCNAGAAYTFERAGTTWTETAKLISSDGACQDIFGFDVSIHTERILIGAPRKTVDGFFRSGAAYLFERSGASWSQALRLESVTGSNFEFGRSVALEKRAAAVGALFAPGPSAPGTGNAYLFTEVAGSWSSQGLFAASAGAQYDELGASIDLSGATLVSGAEHADPLGSDSGAAFVFDTGMVFTSFCDRTDLAACPCGNAGDAKTDCDAPSSNRGVALEVLGQDVTQGRALLLASGFPTTTLPTAVVVRSETLENPAAFGDGLRCLTLPLTRLAARQAINGQSLHTFGHGQGAGTFHYQVWYRSSPQGFCDPVAAYNVTNGVTLTW